MTDFNLQTSRWCSTNEHYVEVVPGSKGAKYTVRYGTTPQGPYQYGWSCTCPAFKFKGGDCKHIKAVESNRCAHGHDACMGSPSPMGETCPECGSETSVIRVAV
jgi:hypothetical protein